MRCRMPWSNLRVVIVSVALVATACASPSAPGSSGSAPGTTNAGAPPPSTQAPKRIVLAMNQPVEGFTELFGGPQSGWRVPYLALHDFLVILDDGADPHPRLASEIPSQASGSWTVNADGTMATTWKLRPGVTWHNGQPLRPQDFVFGWQVATDPALPFNKKAVAAAIDRIDTPDDLTLVYHWKSLYPFADRIQQGDLDPFPSWDAGLLDTYQNNKAEFVNDPWLSKEFVGLGPYRLGAWDPGVSFELDAYDHWYGGRAKISQIEVRNMGDDNARLAAILAGEVDVTPANG